jgi:hypothetical protein
MSTWDEATMSYESDVYLKPTVTNCFTQRQIYKQLARVFNRQMSRIGLSLVSTNYDFCLSGHNRESTLTDIDGSLYKEWLKYDAHCYPELVLCVKYSVVGTQCILAWLA